MEKTVDNLQYGETLLTTVRKVNGGKIHLEFAELIRDPNKPVDARGMFNASDDRFSSPRPRRAWLSAEPADAKRLLPQIAAKVDECVKLEIDPDDAEANKIQINMLNPMVQGKRLRVQIVETTEGDDWKKANLDKATKFAPSTGRYHFHNGKNIFSNNTVVHGDARNVFLATTETSEYPDGSDLQTAQQLIEPQKVTETIQQNQ